MADYDIKGFGVIPEFISNTPGHTSAVGELDNHSRTYSKDQYIFEDPTKDSSRLVVFSATTGGSDTTVPQDVADKFLDIMHFALNNFNTLTGFSDQVDSEFGESSSVADPIQNIDSGADITHQGKLVTSWLYYEHTIGANTYKMRVWFTTASFTEYPLFEIAIVSPTNVVSELASTFVNVTSAIAKVDLGDHIERMEIARSNKPVTRVEVVELSWQDPTDTSLVINKVNFTCFVHGPQGSSRDNLLEAIRQYLVANSSLTVEQWVTYFPELLNVDVFVLVPSWQRVSLAATVGGGSSTVSVHNPIFQYDVSMERARAIVTDKTLTELKPVSDIVPLAYKNLTCIVVGDDKNDAGRKRFGDVYTDYAILEVNSPEYTRQSALTKSCMSRIAVMIRLAESDDGSSILPTGYTRTSSGTGVFIEATENGFVFRMTTKKSYLAAQS